MKTKAAERRSSSTNSNLVQQRSGSQSFFQKRSSTAGHAPAEPAFFHAPVQAKLNIGRPDDKYEKEADAMADKVVSGHDQIGGSLTAQVAPTGVQQKCAACEENDEKKQEEEKVQAKSLHPQISPLIQRQAEGTEEEEEVQAKMEEEENVQRKEEEEEAIQARQDVQREAEKEEEVQTRPEVQRQADLEEEENVQRQQEEEETMQTKLELQRQEEDEEELQPKMEEEEEALQAKPDRASNGAANIENTLRASKGTGGSMKTEVRIEMENKFGADFSGVRIHTGSTAVQMSKDIHAQAFTHQNDIYFNTNKYRPDSKDGKHLLAHELTHTIQQGGVPLLNRRPIVPDIQLEEEATDFEEELLESNQDAVDATDARPAMDARQEAVGEMATGAASAAENFDTTSGASPPPPPVEITGEGDAQDGNGENAALTQEPPVGPTGKYLEETSSEVCGKAAQDAGKLANNEQTHDDAGKKLGQSEGAVVPPVQEGQAQGNAGQVQQLDSAEAPDPKERQAKDKMNEELSKAVPKKVKELNEFKSKGKAKVVGNAVLGVVNKDVGKVKSTYNKIETAPTPVPAETPTELPPEKQPPGTPKLNLGKEAVPAVPAEQTDMSQYQEQSDDLLKKEEISEENLNMVDSGDLFEANKEQGDLKGKVETQPAQLQEFAKQETQQVETDLQQEEQQARGEMKSKRKNKLGKTKDEQQKTKSAMELKREEVTNHINQIYETAKTAVTTKLDNLEKQALQRFDEGQARASVEFENEVNTKINAWKRKRYSGIFGGAKWLKDKFFGIDDFPEVKRAFDNGRQNFIRKIDQLILDITTENKKVIADCKKELADAKIKIKEYVDSLAPGLKDIGEKSLKEMESKLAELDGFIDKKAKELEKKLCDKKEEAIKKIDEKIEKMKEAMSGLLSKLGNLLLNAMVKFFKWALEKAGYASGQLMGIINKGKAVIKKIVTDPIGFIKNLVSAVGKGIGLFSSNIKKHIMGGLMNWLTGAMGDVQITLPEKWDLKGIFSLVLQVLRLTWTNIRARLVKKIPEKVVAAAEKSVDIVKRLVKEGPIALWDMLKEKAAEIKKTVISGIRNFAIFELVKQGIVKLLSFLNPAGAIVQAILAIYNTIMFFVENWNRIVDFVKSIFSSVGDMAMGKIGAAAKTVERAMAMAIPIILNFLMRLLGIGGIGKAVVGIIQKVGKKIQRVIDKMVNFIAKKIRKLFGKVKQGAKKAVGKIVQWWKARKKFKNKDGENHTLFFEGKGNGAKLMIASQKSNIEKYLDDYPDKTSNEYKNAKTAFLEKKKIIFSPATKGKKASDKRKKIIKALAKLSAEFAKLGGGQLKAKDYPNTTTPTYSGPPPKTNKIEYVVGKAKNGTKPKKGRNTGTVGWDKVFDAGLTKQSDKWVQMHVVTEQLGGRAIPRNLISAPNSVNTGHFRTFEHSVVKLANKKSSKVKSVVWFSATVDYYNAKFAKSINAEAGLYLFKGRKAGVVQWEKNKTPSMTAQASIPLPKLHIDKKTSLNFSSGTDLKKVIKDKKFVEMIKINRYYKTTIDFENKMRVALEKIYSKSATTNKIKAVRNKMPDQIVLNNP